MVAQQVADQIYEPIMAMVPPDARGKLEPAEIFHEILEHRWFLSEARRRTRSTSSTPRATTSRTCCRSRPNEALADAETGVLMRILDPILDPDAPVRDAADPDR